MSDDLRRDAVVREWMLAEVPGHAPARLRDGIRDQVAETRQERPAPAFKLDPNRVIRWAAIGATLLVAGLIGGFVIGSPRTNVAPTPTAPTPSPSESALAASPAPTPRGPLLPAGTYTSASFSPAISLALPTGWTLEDDRRDAVSLARPGAGHVVQGDGALYFDAIRLYARPVAGQPDGTLPGVAGVGTTARDLAAWLADRPQLSVTGGREGTIAGLTASVLEFELSSSAGDLCGIRCANLLDGPDFGAQYRFGIEGPWRLRAYLVDAPDGSTVMITIEDTDGVGFDEEAVAAEAILATLRFLPEPGGSSRPAE